MTSILCSKEFDRVDALANRMLASVEGEQRSDELVLAALEVAVRVIRDRAHVSPRVALLRVRRVVASIAMLWPTLPTTGGARRFRHAPTRDSPPARVQIPDPDPRQLHLFTDG